MDPCLGTIGNQRICDGSEKVSARKSYDECDPNMHNAQHGAFWKNTDRDTFVSRRTDAWGQAAAVSAGQTFTFNDGTATTMPNGVLSNFIWSNAENAATPPQPVNIQRLTPINQSTAATNAVWQGALKARNSIWQFYQLTMTQ